MRVAFKPALFGLEKASGWIVTFNGAIVASLYASDDGEVGLRWGYEVPWICRGQTWISLDDAKAEFRNIAKLYAQGMTPRQLQATLDDLRHPPRNEAERRARKIFRSIALQS